MADYFSSIYSTHPSINYAVPVSSSDVLATLALLALITFLQRRTLLSSLLEIEPATYRLLRVLPFVALFDAGACLTALALSWLQPQQYRAQRHISTGEVLKGSDDEEEKLTQKYRAIAQRKPSKLSIGQWKRLTLALCLLARLTTFHGVGFSAFCAWVFFLASLFNELACHYVAFNDLSKKGTRPHTRQTGNTASESFVSVDVESLKFAFQHILAVSFMYTMAHIAWLAKFLVPRTLWMDWGPPQGTGVNSQTMHFDLPPRTPGPVIAPIQAGGELVIGFWPSHTYSGLFFSSMSYVACIVLFLTTVVLIFEFFVLTVLLPHMYICFQLYLAIEPHVSTFWEESLKETWVGRLVSLADENDALLAERVREYPLLSRTCMKAANTILFMVYMFSSGCFITGVLAFPLYALAFEIACDFFGFFEMTGINSLFRNLFDDFFIIFFDKPDGSYATLTGVLIGIGIICFRRWIVPLIVKEAHVSASREERRYWTVLWTTVLLCLLSSSYYHYYFNARGTGRPAWTGLFVS